METEIYRRLGQSWEQFKRRPAREVEEYLQIIQLINREEQIRAAQQRASLQHRR